MNYARELFRLAILGASNHQVTHIVVTGSIFAETRAVCGRCHPKLGQLVTCYLCFGTWVGFIQALIFRPCFTDVDKTSLPFQRPARSRQLAGLLADSFAIALAGRFFTEILAILRYQAEVKEEQRDLLGKQIQRGEQPADLAAGEAIPQPTS